MLKCNYSPLYAEPAAIIGFLENKPQVKDSNISVEGDVVFLLDEETVIADDLEVIEVELNDFDRRFRLL